MPNNHRLATALALAAKGFYIFPCIPNGKLPAIKDFPNKASRDPDQLQRWFADGKCNLGISTSSYGEGQALVVVDIDNKGEKQGDETLFSLELEGKTFPPSLEQITPNNGRHILYATPVALRQGVDVLGPGLDIRSRGGYILGPSSEIDGRSYRPVNSDAAVVTAPGWLVDHLGVGSPAPVHDNVTPNSIDGVRAVRRGELYLKTAPAGVQGSRNATAYKIVTRLKDLGCSEAQCVDLMLQWECAPPLESEELNHVIRSAFKYGRDAPGDAAPEAVFTAEITEEAKHPATKLNEEYAFIKAGAFVLQETTDAKGRFCTIRLSPADMHAWFANKTLSIGDKAVPLSKVWMTSVNRREYDNVVFSPCKEVPSRFYNLWRGFSVEPASSGSHKSVDQFREHVLANVCGGSEELAHWLTAYFAHMVQKPWQKPLVALVFRGAKGVGKNALVERVGALLGKHFMVADDERYLLGNFNSHLEANLFFVLDEAAWAGDKRAEGKLKGLITGSQHVIERKGFEPYEVDNLTRVAIIGNEKWLVPASQDERRFAVFNVGNKRKQDRAFFESMKSGMEGGGYSYLLRYLIDYNILGVDLNAAPSTQGLIDQKHASLDPLAEWWLDCLAGNSLAGSDWEGVIPAVIPTNRLRQSFEVWARSRNIRSRLPGRNDFFRAIGAMAKHLEKTKARPENDNDSSYAFCNPGIETLRADWDLWIGGKHDWAADVYDHR